MAIKVYPKDSREYANLAIAAQFMSEFSPNGNTYSVRETYFDFGQGWMWTTIIAKKENGDTYQALCPRDHKRIVDAESDKEIIALIEDKV